MAKKKEGEEKAGKSNKLLYVLAVIGAVGALKGFVLGGGSPATAAVNPDGTPVTVTTVPGPIVTLEPITLNIDGGRFLKVGLGLQMAGDYVAGAGHAAADSDDSTKGFAKALDLAIEVLGGKSFDQLVTPEGRSHAKEELTEQLHEAYHEEVEGVYFTEFVMQ